MLGTYGWMPERLSILSLMILSQSSLFLSTQIIGLEQAQSSHNRPHAGLDASTIFQSCIMDVVNDNKPSPPANNPRH
jgi:hypothetical protein